MRSKTAVPLLLVTMVIAGTAVATLGQETNTPNRRVPPEIRRPLAAGGGQFMEGLGPVAQVLTEEQRASFVGIMQSQRVKIRELEMKTRAARQALFQASLGGKFDEERARKPALALAELQAERTLLGLKALSEIQPPLSAEQIERISNVGPAGAGRPGPRAGIRELRAGRGRTLTNTNRDENDLPPKR